MGLFTDNDKALALRNKIDCCTISVLRNDHFIWLAELRLHSLHDWLNQLLLLTLHVPLCHLTIPGDLHYRSLELKVFLDSTSENLD